MGMMIEQLAEMLVARVKNLEEDNAAMRDALGVFADAEHWVLDDRLRFKAEIGKPWEFAQAALDARDGRGDVTWQ